LDRAIRPEVEEEKAQAVDVVDVGGAREDGPEEGREAVEIEGEMGKPQDLVEIAFGDVG
jgi:hypothetical protein